MKRPLAVSLLAALALGGIAYAQGWLQAKPDKENVVASRLVGSWTIDAALSKRLTGRARNMTLTFTDDPQALAGLDEAKYGKLFTNRQVYLIGKMKLSGRPEVPYALTSYHGNPYVFFFRPRGGDPLGDSESFSVMLARGKTKAQDLLFIGGDFNNTSFMAFKRAEAKPAAGQKADLSTPEGVVKAWIAAVKKRDKAAALALGTKAWQEKESTWKRSFTHAIFDLGWKLKTCKVRTSSSKGDSASVSCRAVFVNEKGEDDNEGLRFKLEKVGEAWKIIQLH